VLGALGGDAAVVALQPLTQDKDRAVAQAATRALERIKTTEPPRQTQPPGF
jgi:hypothetical protein